MKTWPQKHSQVKSPIMQIWTSNCKTFSSWRSETNSDRELRVKLYAPSVYGSGIKFHTKASHYCNRGADGDVLPMHLNFKHLQFLLLKEETRIYVLKSGQIIPYLLEKCKLRFTNATNLLKHQHWEPHKQTCYIACNIR